MGTHSSLGERLARFARFIMVVGCLVFSSSLQAQVTAPNLHYFMTIFSYQSALFNLPSDSHTFATFFATNDQGEVIPNTRFDISWLPYNADVRFLGPAVVGRNFSLEESFAITLTDSQGRIDPNSISNSHRIRRFGPFGLAPEVYNRGLAMHNRLAYWGGALAQDTYNAVDGNIQAGNGTIIVPGIFYKAVDKNSRLGHFVTAYDWNPFPQAAINCIHAVSDIMGFVETGDRRGFEGGRIVARWLNQRHPGGRFLSTAMTPFNQYVASRFYFRVGDTYKSIADISLDN